MSVSSVLSSVTGKNTVIGSWTRQELVFTSAKCLQFTSKPAHVVCGRISSVKPSKASSTQAQLPGCSYSGVSSPLPPSSEAFSNHGILSNDSDDSSATNSDSDDSQAEVEESSVLNSQGPSQNLRSLQRAAASSPSPAGPADATRSRSLCALAHRTRIALLEVKVSGLQGELGTMRDQLDYVAALQVQAQRENGRLRHQLYSSKRHVGRVVDMGEAEVVTSETGNARMAELEASRLQKEVEKRARDEARQKVEDEVQRERREMGENIIFSQPLTKLLKPGLRNLSWALKLSETGSTRDMLDRIRTHFANHPEDKDRPRFSGLFPPRNRVRKRQQNLESTDHTQVDDPEPAVSLSPCKRPAKRSRPRPRPRLLPAHLSLPGENSPGIQRQPSPSDAFIIRRVLGNRTNTIPHLSRETQTSSLPIDPRLLTDT